MLFKKWHESKTIWINALTLAVSVLTEIAASDLLSTQEKVVIAITGIVIPIINVFLRFITSQPIEKKVFK